MSQNSFWDTVKGHQLADVLIHCLPVVAKNATTIKQTEQYSILVNVNVAQSMINSELKNGARIIHVAACSYDTTNDTLLIIFEKKV